MDDAGTARSSPVIWPRRACLAPQPSAPAPSSAPVAAKGSRPQGPAPADPHLGLAADGDGPDPLIGMVAGVRREVLYLEEAHAEVVTRLREGAAAEVGRLLEAAQAEAAALLESARLVAAATSASVRGGAHVDAG